MAPLGYQGGTFAFGPLPLSLAPLQAFNFPPGDWQLQAGRYSQLEWFDANLGIWRAVDPTRGNFNFTSDGFNYRVINRTGGPQGAILTNLGSGLVNGFGTVAIVPSAGGSIWKSIVGGAINTTVTVTTAGAYAYPPTLVFPQAPAGGITPTAIAVIAANAISSVTVINRGAGLSAAPTSSLALSFQQSLQFNWSQQGNRLVIVQDPRDTLAGGGVLTVNATLAGSGTMTGMLCTDPGTAPVTSLPTFTFNPASTIAATAIMNWTVTGFTVGAGGAVYGNAQNFIVRGSGLRNATVGAGGDVQPDSNIGIVTPRQFLITGVSTAGGAIQAAGAIIEDAGFGIQAVPIGVVTESNGAGTAIPTTNGQVTITVGGTNDIVWLQQRKI